MHKVADVAIRIALIAGVAAMVVAVPSLLPADPLQLGALAVGLAIYVATIRVAHRMTFDLPIPIAIGSIFGPAAATAFVLAGTAIGVRRDGTARTMRRMLDGTTQAVLWGAAAIPSAHRFDTFFGIYALASLVFLAAFRIPVRALVLHRPTGEMLASFARDTRLFTYLALAIAWGYLCVQCWQAAGPIAGVALFAPLPMLARNVQLIRTQRADLRRLRLARDAVQAMLVARDPLPQMRALLAALHTPSLTETIQVYGAIAAEDDRLSALATVGTAPTPPQTDALRQALLALRRSDRHSSVARAGRATIAAFAARGANDELLGALVVCRATHALSQPGFARFAAAALDLTPLLRDVRAIAQTQNAATFDALTGLLNRRTVMEYVRDQIERVGPTNPCAVLLLDIDRFKAINDSLGHQTGDRYLHTVGTIVAQNIRGGDRAGRLGGEEFLVLMPDTTRELAIGVGERLRGAIEGAGMHHASGTAVTVSIGVAVADVGDTADSLLSRADRALYQAKHEGRNRVIEIGA